MARYNALRRLGTGVPRSMDAIRPYHDDMFGSNPIADFRSQPDRLSTSFPSPGIPVARINPVSR